MNATWGLLVWQHKYTGSGGEMVYATTVLDHVTGTREDAIRALYHHALHFEPQHPRGGAHRRLVYEEDDGYLLVSEGTMTTFQCHFTVRRLLHNSAAVG